MFRRYWKLVLILLVPLALYAYIAECNSWRPKTIVVAPKNEIIRIEFSPDGEHLVAVSRGVDYFCNVASRTSILIPAEMAAFLPRGAFFMDKNHLVGWPKDQNHVRKRESVETLILNNEITLVSPPTNFDAIGVLANGRTFIGFLWDNPRSPFQADFPIWSWNADSKKAPQLLLKLHRTKNEVPFCHLLADHNTLLVSLNDGSPLQIWNLSHKAVRYLKSADWAYRGGFVGSTKGGLLFLHDYIGQADYDRRVEIGNYLTGSHLRRIDLKQSIETDTNGLKIECTHNLTLSPEGELIAGCDLAGKTIKVWDTKTGGIIRNIQGNYVESLAFSSDGRTLAAGDAYGTIKLWRIK